MQVSGGDTMRWWGHLNPTTCKRICFCTHRWQGCKNLGHECLHHLSFPGMSARTQHLILHYRNHPCPCQQRSCGKVMFLCLSVILSMGVCVADLPPPCRHPSRQTPTGRPPFLHSACWGMVNKWVVSILPE